jgi:hypothetical protein
MPIPKFHPIPGGGFHVPPVVPAAPGALISKVIVQPATAQPGEPVFVQVLDANGQPYTKDTDAKITIEDAECCERYFQFSQPGDRQLVVRVSKGGAQETVLAPVSIQGAAVAFHLLPSAPPVVEIPMLQVSQDPHNPYCATFTLGAPPGYKAGPPAAILPSDFLRAHMDPGPSPKPHTAFDAAAAKALANVPADKITRLLPKTETRAGVAMTTSSTYAPITGSVIARNPDWEKTGYDWDFGDGTVDFTSSPTVRHDFTDAISPDRIAHSFHVSCTVKHDNLVVQRTLVLYSAYGICKLAGTIVPHVTGEVYTKLVCDTNKKSWLFCGSMQVRNFEAQAITLTDQACVPLGKDPDASLGVPKFVTMQVPVTIGPNSVTAVGMYVAPWDLFGKLPVDPTMLGITVYYRGAAADGTRVRLSHTFQVSGADAELAARVKPFAAPPPKYINQVAVQSMAETILAGPGPLVTQGGDVRCDPATKTLAIPIAKSADPRAPATKAKVQSAVEAGAIHIAAQLAAAPAPPPPPPAPPGSVQEGQPCDPDNISDDDRKLANDQNLVCALSGAEQLVDVPASFCNAQKGDIILSPGGDGPGEMIGALLRALDQPQYHSHSGIMTRNFVEITHCTASPDRVKKNVDALHGFQPDLLHYAWPGAITQSIDAATTGTGDWKDSKDSQDTYHFSDFTPEPLGVSTDGEFKMVPPLVVKPLPENEQDVRPILRQVAETARSCAAYLDDAGNLVYPAKGYYYSFYCYTKPEIALGGGSAAGAEAGWAQGMSPAVCASFIWLCMKANNVSLVTKQQYELPSDLRPDAVAQGAAVGSTTLDGLFYYPEDERRRAGEMLFQILKNKVLDEYTWLRDIPGIGPDYAGKFADQMLNMFAFGDPDMFGKSDWKDHPGDANAVSPENINWWNAPIFGYAEPLQYLEPHQESRRASTWQKTAASGPAPGDPAPAVTTGSITGYVYKDGKPLQGARVWIYDGKSAMTDGTGYYALANVPLGSDRSSGYAASYLVSGSWVSPGGIGAEYTDSQEVTLTENNYNAAARLDLKGPPDSYRRLDLHYAYGSDHWDCNVFHSKGWQGVDEGEQFIPLNPDSMYGNCSVQFSYADGTYFLMEWDIRAALLIDLSIDVTITAKMLDPSGENQIGTAVTQFNVPVDGQGEYDLHLKVTGTCWRNGDSEFKGTATNSHETS